MRTDPSERTNLINDTQYAEQLKQLEHFLEMEKRELVPVPGENNLPTSPEGNPEFYSNTWSPGWCCL